MSDQYKYLLKIKPTESDYWYDLPASSSMKLETGNQIRGPQSGNIWLDVIDVRWKNETVAIVQCERAK